MQSFFCDIAVYRYADIVLESMGDIEFADEELQLQGVQGQVVAQVVGDVVADLQIEFFFGILGGQMVPVVDQPVQMEDQSVELQGYLGFPGEAFAFQFIDQLEYHGLDGVERNRIVVEPVVVGGGNVLEQIDIVEGDLHQPVAIVLADP